MGCRCALAINPMTLVENTYSLLKKADQLLCMSVNPGFMGQPFIIEVLEKVRLAHAYRDKNHLHFDISIDGGVTDETVGPCVTRARIKSSWDVRSSCRRMPARPRACCGRAQTKSAPAVNRPLSAVAVALRATDSNRIVPRAPRTECAGYQILLRRI